MECPKCGWVRNKKAWRPCQWNREKVECGDFHQCKVCDGEMAHENTWHWRPGMQTTQSHQRSDHKCVRPLPTHEGTDIPFQALQLQELASNCNSYALAGIENKRQCYLARCPERRHPCAIRKGDIHVPYILEKYLKRVIRIKQQ